MGFFDFSVNKVKIPVQVIQTCMIFNKVFSKFLNSRNLENSFGK